MDDTVFVVLSWCHRRAWDALLNQKWEKPQNLCSCMVQGQLPLRTSHGASVVLHGLRTFLGGENLWKTLRGNGSSGFGMGKADLLMQSHKKPAASSIPFCPTCILDHLELSFNSWANTVLHPLSHLAPCAQQVGCQVSVQEVPACPVALSQG